MNTWHAHATGLKQMAASFSAVPMSAMSACEKSISHVPPLLGHGGRQSAHASGAGSPPLRAVIS